MTFYPPKVHAKFSYPTNAGKAVGENGVGTAASFECGSFVRISLTIEEKAKVIQQAGFQSNGCGYMVAAAEVIAEILTGKGLVELHGLGSGEYKQLLWDELGEFPESRGQCARVVLSALKEALADYRARLLEEFIGEKALICTCFSITQEAIEAFVVANSPLTVNQVSEGCRAGSGCGSCRMLIEEMIDARRA